MYKNIFQKAGLSPTQADIMEYLFAKKQDKASNNAKSIKKSRAIVYKDLDELVDLNIVERADGPAQVSLFSIGHPTQMEKFFDQKENQIKKDRELFNNYLPDMVSNYNLLHSKPGVKYYEGLKGIIKALESISSRFVSDTEILSFTKVLPNSNSPELIEAINIFLKKRVRKNVKTRVIALDTEESKKLIDNDKKNLRQTKLVKKDFMPFDFPGGEIFIYKNQIYTVTVENKQYFAFTIENQSIAQMLKAFFEVEWSLLSSQESSL